VVINFVIIAFIVFMMVRYVNRIRASLEKPAEEPAPEAPAAPPPDIVLLTEIRDALKK
jgi:large conductance mechanosensitive channel